MEEEIKDNTIEEKEEKTFDKKLIEESEKAIKTILDDGLQPSDVDILYKLTKINHIAKESESMNYGNYGNYGNNYGNYGNYGGYGNYGRNSYGRENYGAGSYGRRGVDSKYRGDEEMDRMMGEYGRYMENRSRYGAGEETDKSFHYMVKALEDFIKVLHEEVETPQQKQELMTALQNSMR